MHGLVLLDEADRSSVRRSCGTTSGRRPSATRSARPSGRERLIEITGNDALTGFTAPKLVWVRDHEPDVWARVAHVLLPKDYVRLRLTGEYALDKADGAGTILFDLAARDWSPEVLAALAIDPAWMPPTFEGPAGHGDRHRRRSRAATGLRAGTPVVAGGGDQAANAVGVGVVDPGTMALSLGTSGVVFAATDRPIHEPRGIVHAFCHAVPDRWHLMSVMLSAAGSLRWFRDAVAPGRGVRGARGCGGGGRPGERRPLVPPLPHRGAEPASGPARSRRVRRAHRDPRPAAPDAGRPGGRGVRAS